MGKESPQFFVLNLELRGQGIEHALNRTQIVLQGLGQKIKPFDDLFRIFAGNDYLSLSQSNARWQIVCHQTAEIFRKSKRHLLGLRRWTRLQAPRVYRGGKILAGKRAIEEFKQSFAVDEMGSAHVLNAADGAHEHLRGGALYLKKALHIAPGPGLDARAFHTIADLVETIGPGDGFRHGILLGDAIYQPIQG